MKKVILLFVGVLCTPIILAQSVSDALRYTQDDVQGTARYRALSGAFGALGGDMSAVSVNPAGSSVFNTSHISVTLSNLNTKNKTSYFNGKNSSTNSNIDLSQTGAAFVFNNGNANSPWRKFTLGIAYDKLKDYDDDWFAHGTNTNNSIDRYFLSITENQNIPFGVLKLQPGEYIEDAYANIGADPNYGYLVQQVFLGYWAGIIDPLNMDNDTNDDNLEYVSNTAPANSFYQEYNYAATGYNGKFAFNFSTEYNNRLYLGVNLNSHFINYDRVTSFYETNSNVDAAAKNILFENQLNTTGSGFSFDIGAIAKVTNNFRVGLAYKSPTWYKIEEELIQDIYSDNADPEIGYISTIINLYPSYNIQSPGKLTGSLAYVFGNFGLISFDYSVKDYSNTKFKPTSDPHFSQQNTIMSNNLTTASTYRIGGEYKFRQLSFRAGYRFEESPYKNETTISDLKGYSLGLGYSFGSLLKLDLTFDQAQRESSHQLFETGLTDAAHIDSKTSNIALSVSFNL